MRYSLVRVTMLRTCGLLASLIVMGQGTLAFGQVPTRCELPDAAVLRQDGNTVMLQWDLSASPIWMSGTLPDAPGYAAYRAGIKGAGNDLLRPRLILKSDTEVEREIARREEHNTALMYSGAGYVRPIRCLEAALFAFQDARYSELTNPTEFIAHILRRGERLKVFFGASDSMFPHKDVYGLAEVASEVQAGWEYLSVLHNHTIQTLDGKPALGVPAPSTSDVALFRGIGLRLNLREVWVTNGMYTGVVPAEHLSQFRTRD
jgi:hypothetical protein